MGKVATRKNSNISSLPSKRSLSPSLPNVIRSDAPVAPTLGIVRSQKGANAAANFASMATYLG